MLYSKHLPTLLGFILGLCLLGCLLSVRQGYMGRLCWPFSHQEGLCLGLSCTQSSSLPIRLASLQPQEAEKFMNFQYWHKLLIICYDFLGSIFFVILPFSTGLLLFAPRSYGILKEQHVLPRRCFFSGRSLCQGMFLSSLCDFLWEVLWQQTPGQGSILMVCLFFGSVYTL